MVKHTVPVCILGGGPAGLTASLFLSKFGVQHVLVEKSSYPRDKVCGECFDGRVERTLEALAPAYLEEMKMRGLVDRTWRYALQLKETRLVVNFPRQNRPKLLISRLVFDQFLYEKARASRYAKIITNTTVTEEKEVGKKMLLKGNNIQVQARLVIVATGAHAMMRSAAKSAKSTMIYGRRYYKNILPQVDNEVEVYYLQKPLRGCLVICPLPEGRYNVEIGCSRAAYKACGLSLDEIMATYVGSLPDLSRRFVPAVPLDKMKGTYLPLPTKLAQCAADHYLWAGSNVYSFNPLTGAGVGNAMVMGKLAAETARECVKVDDYSYRLTRQYQRNIQRRLRGMIRFNRAVNLLIRYVHLFEWLLPFFMKRKFVQRLLGQTDFVRRIFVPRYWFRSPPNKRQNLN